MAAGASHAAVQAAHVAAAPESVRGILTRAYARQGRPNAVKAKCLDCCHFDRGEVRDCTTYRCPLWAWRPFQAPEDDAQGGE